MAGDRTAERNRLIPTRAASGRLLLLVAALPLLASCSTPVGAKPADPRAVYREVNSTALAADSLGLETRNVLHERDLVLRYEKDPAAAIAELHEVVVDGTARPDDLFALSEMSLLHAARTKAKHHYLASAVYAWAYLFPETGPAPNPFDPRFRMACDMYNRGVEETLTSNDGRDIEVRGGRYRLPFGALTLDFDATDLEWGGRTLEKFAPVAELKVRGFRERYRWPGVGAALAAGTAPISKENDAFNFIAPRVRVPSTAVVHIPEPLEQLRGHDLHGTLDLHTVASAASVTIDGRDVPLEVEPTASLALMLTETDPWRRELRGFLQRVGTITTQTRLVSMQPYHPGRIPVVFVHGTASSAARWAEMVNTLYQDPEIRSRFQFWFFSYDTGSPIAYSSLLLRDALENAVAKLDPGGTDAALRQMVVIGHSQGGLLTKMTVVDSGSQFWDNFSSRPLAQLTALTPSSRELLRRGLFVTPLPFVHRVIFIATPHQGSYMAGNRLAHWVARFVSLPLDLARTATDLARLNTEGAGFRGTNTLPTSIDNMTPGNQFIKTLSGLPIAPGVHAHSIIAVKGEGPPDDGTDGIVKYRSAHVADLDSELVVRSPHSCQGNPHTIGEVQRILRVHIDQQAAQGRGSTL
jgi:hypothetical protein